MRATVDLKLAYAIIGRPQSEEPSQLYQNVDVTIEQVQSGRDQQLIINLHEPLDDLAEFNQVWVTVNGRVQEGIGRLDAGHNRILVTLYRHQTE
ncbi:hypothetical protein ACXUPC_13990 [Pseudomonas marginalis]|uniref:hypothetical protein n=1 Tax=Pseudomonas marginalis TaxID=298 RepID=UPI0038B53F9C